MAKINIREIRDRAATIDGALAEGAPTKEFGGIKQAELHQKIAAADAIEQDIAELLAQVELKKAQRDNAYADLNNDLQLVVNGVRGDKDFGEDSALYGTMGYVRKSERASGLTRKTKTPVK